MADIAVSGSRIGRLVRRTRAWWCRRAETRPEDGFILIESMIAITVITIVMTAVGAEFLGAMISTSQQRAQQVAVQIAGSAVDQIRALDASDLTTGRGSTSVSNQFDAAPPVVRPWLVNMDQAPDTTAAPTSGTTVATASIPTVGVPTTPSSPAATDGRVIYTTEQYLGWCYIGTLSPPGTPSPGSTGCVTRASLGNEAATQYLRAVVAVTWKGPRCAGTGVPASSRVCSYVTSTLVSATVDRTFRLNAGAYPGPVIVAKPVQTVVVGDNVSLLMTVSAGKGVPPFTWSDDNNLPPGLGPIDPSTGRITGTVGDSFGTFTSRVTVTDAFLRTDVEDVTWNVLRPLTYTNPGSLNSTKGNTVNRPILGAAGGEAPYTFSDPTTSLPPGLTVSSAGVISGTPNQTGTYTVRIRLTDSGARIYTDPFTWTVRYPTPAVTNPGTQTSPVSTALAPPLQLNATGGSGTYTWSDATTPTLPPGLVLNTSTGLITGIPTVLGSFTVTLTVASGGSTSTVTFIWLVVESTPPTNAITLSEVTGGAFKAANTVYYKGDAAGSFTLTNALTDAGSGPASSQTAALGGTSTGWTHTPSTVSTPIGGPYVSNAFSWTNPTTSAPTEVVTGRDGVGNQTGTTLTFTNDTGNPSLGSISYADGYTSGRSVTLTFASGTDSGSGVNAAAARIKRTVAPLVNGVCGTGVTNNGYLVAPTSPYTDTNVATGNCYSYQYVTIDNVGNTSFASSASVAKVDYNGAVTADAGLLSLWRFGETPITSSDSFTEAAGVALSSHTSTIDGTTWTRRAGDTGVAVATDGNRIRNSTIAKVAYYTDETPASADYLVEADLHVKSLVPGDHVGLVGRLDPAGATFGTYYTARYNAPDSRWEIYKFVNGTGPTLATGAVNYSQTLTVGQTYRMGLEMEGSTIRLLVDGIPRVTATDTSIAAAGRAGVRLISDTTATTNTTGMHLDNFEVSYPAVDSKGSNTGDYHRGVTLRAPGAIAGDSNTAASYDGVNDSMQVPVPTNFPVGAASRTVETWFKTSGVGSGMLRQALFSYGTNGTGQEFGAWLESDGIRIKADGGGGADRTFTFATNFNNNQWHHFAQTYDGTTVRMYVDGVAGTGGGAAVTLNTVMNTSYGFTAAAVPDASRGALSTQSYFNGSLDEMAFYTSTMSAATALGHYQVGTSPATADATGPTGGSVDAGGLVGTRSRYSTSTTLSIGFSPGTDPSGLRTTGRALTRATATLTSTAGADGVCGAFGAYSLVTGGNDPVSPKTDTVADQACYRYKYAVEDFYGNPTTYTSGDIKVDTTVPSTPALSFSDFSSTYWGGSGSTVYYRSGTATGSFRATASSSDAASGVAGYTFPSLGTNWTSTPVSLGVNTYSWSVANAASGTADITATSNATATSANSPFTLTSDNAAPSAGTVTYVDGNAGGNTVSVSFTTGTDAGSGLGTRSLQRASAPRAGNGTCGTYTAFATVPNGTNPTSPVANTVTAGSCYKYQYVVSDNVGNFHTAVSANVAYAPWGAHWAYNAGSGTSAVDSTGNGYTGTLNGTASWTTGRVGSSALTVTGAATSFMSTPSPVIDSSESFSVAAWVKFSTLTGSQNITTVEGTNVSAFFLKKDSAGVFAFTRHSTDATASPFAQVNGLSPVAGTWYHVVGVYNKTAATIQLYVNGSSQGSVASSPTWKASGATVVGRGRFNGISSDFTNGAIDEVRYYDRAITSAEVTTLAGQ